MNHFKATSTLVSVCFGLSVTILPAAAQQDIDRTSLPIPDPVYEKITELELVATDQIQDSQIV